MTAESIEIIVKRLKSHFIDDRQYAMNYVDNYLRTERSLYLKYRLQEKG